MSNKYNEYKNLNDFKRRNLTILAEEYRSGKNHYDSMRNTDDMSFDDFCMCKWQML